ncbi:hypothetical protein BV898_19734 [Hypsibius exemplaris]|uniref:Uncharacterized protein n=1 Tax=Hypsibius exemplaris TaxID=2072580 RepID=A0A9X6NJH5_HYPEX|nr:hypothetical protein BV898_19734 [Hypsibius exemplaris]
MHASTAVISGLDLQRKNINKEAGSDTASLSMKPRGFPKLRTSSLMAAIEKDLSGSNPLTRSALSLKYGVSATTIARVINQDSEGKVRKKCRVHALSNKQAKQRLDRGPRFLCYINGLMAFNTTTTWAPQWGEPRWSPEMADLVDDHWKASIPTSFALHVVTGTSCLGLGMIALFGNFSVIHIFFRASNWSHASRPPTLDKQPHQRPAHAALTANDGPS